MSVHIFKTTVINQSQVKLLKVELDILTLKNEQWNFDLEDCDNILRVKTQDPVKFTKVLEMKGFHFQEL
ncbi:hypothetical protein [Galbibacter sp.]|uniref:hypothetical protein n=1 Tax=Galbibacter sp. TaxID=2918471 RepID=UPI002B54110E|nr:hypothetical protein [Galbibacter sp.]HLV62452.1 hypothetical protein [Galbibacter sp.]